MKDKLIAFILKRINWGALLPKLLRMVAEGKADEAIGLKSYPLKRAYWFAAGKKTFTGAALTFLAAGFAGICGQYEQWPWACDASRYAMLAGVVITGLGVVDGATRAPWPDGTPRPEKD